MSKTHFYGRAAAEAILVTVLVSALLRARSARRGFRYYKATYRSFIYGKVPLIFGGKETLIFHT